jgi:uncharacterized protein
MQKTMRALLVFGAVICSSALAITGAGAQADAHSPPLGQITVTGIGVVQAAPDLAVVSLGVTNQAQTAAAALAANNTAMSAVMARMTEAGIVARDLQTSNLQLSPNWVQSEAMQTPEISGYTASNMLSVQVRDLAILGSVLDAAVQDGANTLQGVSFGQANPMPAEEAARTAAVQDARARAEGMVDAAGASLGRILSITENGGYVQPMPMLRMQDASSGVPVAAGEVGVSAQVTMVFEIIQE